MPWDHGGIPKALSDFLSNQPCSGSVLIPGCGSAHEALAFHRMGWEVDAVDFSEAAIEHARAVHPEVAARVRLGDFFDPAAFAATYDVIYERTFLCSLLPSQRPAYARRMEALTHPGSRLLGFFFFGPEDEPPPYPLDPEELSHLLAGRFIRLEDRPVTDSLPLFQGKERWQIWKRV